MIDLRYLAGFIDGEGWIGIYKAKANGKQQKSARYTLEVGIGQVLKGEFILKMCAEQFGGNLLYYQPKSKNAQPQCKWVILADKAKELLKQIEPYLMLKQNQARMAILFQEEKNLLNTVNNNFRGKLVPLEIIQKRESDYLQMKFLNRKGVHA